MVSPTLVDTLTATNAVVANQIFGDIYQTAARPTSDYALDFELDSAADGFVGRHAVFEKLQRFAAQNRAGYFEIVGEAGLGKTALAAEIARRRDAIVFFAGPSLGADRPDQFLAHVSASLILRYKLGYNTLPARAGEDATYLVRILRESVKRTGGRPIWVVVDALDEAVEPPLGANPLLLPQQLPDGIYVVVTRRAGQLRSAPGTPVRRYALRRDDALQVADIQTLLRTRVGSDSRIREALSASDPPVSEEEFVARFTQASEGNFMYLSYLLEDMAAPQPDEPPLDMSDLPLGLRGYYDQFWDRMSLSQVQNWADWEGLYRPVLERLAVATEAVSVDWLAGQVGRSPDEVRSRVLQPWARLLGQQRREGMGVWRLVHRSFAEYLGDKLDLRSAHSSVARHYVEQLLGQFEQWDDYGLRHTATHLGEAAGRSAGQERHDLILTLVRLVTEQGFQRAHLDKLRDPTLLRNDLELAHRLAAKDEHDDATFLLVQVAVTLVRFRRHLLRPEAMFAAARRGDVDFAERLLDLFSGDVDQDWHDALFVTLAWLASEDAPGKALEVLERYRQTGPSSPTLATLLSRVAAALKGVPPIIADLPPAPTEEQAVGMVARLAGAEGSSLGYWDPALPGGELVAGGGYLAAVDGPPLVALAAVQPVIGNEFLRRYVEVHVAYGYRQYRNGSLWALLDAVLRHPEQSWVRDWLQRLGEAVLASPNRGEFLEGLEISVLALQARAGDAAALQELTGWRGTAAARASQLPASPTRGQGDVWGVHRRRLAALAEAFSQLAGGAPIAADLASRALRVQGGFAGFSAPVSLTLAETVSVVSPGNTDWIERALRAAEEAAHNIQDATFCARSTARVNAMRERWWVVPLPDPVQWLAVITRLSRDPAHPEFSALHVVGEGYRFREESRLPLGYLRSNTLRQLAETYQRPLLEFVRYNQHMGWVPDQNLPEGTRVNVPDPGFPALLAARLAAAMLAEGRPGAAASAQMRHLVPVSGVDVAAQAAVLARLLLCSSAQDAQLLAELRRLVTETTTAMPDQ
jgi:hypothetical protein